MGVDPDADQRWPVYAALAARVLRSSACCCLYALQRLQPHLPLSASASPASTPDQAFNTAASFVTNTNWQSYSGESTMGHLVQMAGLAVQNFVSAAVGMAVAVALIRGFTRSRTDRLGNFWVDLVRGCLRILLPLAVVAALVLVAHGRDPEPLVGHRRHHAGRRAPDASPAARSPRRRRSRSSAPTAAASTTPTPRTRSRTRTRCTNLLEIFLLLLIPFCLTRTFGRMVGDKRQGYAILAAMARPVGARPRRRSRSLEAHHHGTALQLGRRRDGGQGDPVRRVPASALFAASTTGTSTGAVNSFHDSFTALGGGLLIFNMVLGEVAPGGVGSGLYGMLVLAVITVFVAGLMVGRTPEYLGKKITAREIKLVSLYILATPVVVLVGTGLAMALPGPRASILNPGPHGLSEVLYAFMSAANNNGSAFAGHLARTPTSTTSRSAWRCWSAGSSDRLRARAGRLAGPPAAGPGDRRHAAHPPAAVRRRCSSASSSSSPA